MGRFIRRRMCWRRGRRKPDKEKVDKLVKELERAEELRQKKTREKLNQEDGGDVTYINIKVCVFCGGEQR